MARLRAGAWSAQQQAALDAWLAADPLHATAWRQAQAEWEQWGELSSIAAQELASAREPRRPARWHWPAGIAAASLIAMAGHQVVSRLPGAFASPATYETARGAHLVQTLADGSVLELNTGSRVVVNYGMTCRCLQLLGGEAVFRAAHGDPRRFEVRFGQATARDIGTEFWIRGQAKRTAIAVLKGAVEVRARNDGSPRILYRDERMAFTDDGRDVPAGNIPLADLTAWRSGNLVFRDAPLGDVVAEFARYHDVEVRLDGRLNAYHLSGRFATADLDGVLHLITSAYPVTAQRHGRTLRLTLQDR